MSHLATYLVCASLVVLSAAGCNIGHTPTSGDSEPLASRGSTTADSTVPACPHPGQVAVAEECNAFDDDCDGLMDEGVCDDPCNVFDAPARSTRR